MRRAVQVVILVIALVAAIRGVDLSASAAPAVDSTGDSSGVSGNGPTDLPLQPSLPPPPPPQLTVKQGDTFYALADAWGVDRQLARDANPQLENPDLIYPGDILVMPGGVEPPAIMPPATTQNFPSIAATGSNISGPVVFPYGYCTWYVATRRQISWSGNAIDWWPNARSAGRPEGQAPQPGAIMVTRESGWGHVAYVEWVAGTSWGVREMNYVGWGIVSVRTLVPGRAPVVGFIY